MAVLTVVGTETPAAAATKPSSRNQKASASWLFHGLAWLSPYWPAKGSFTFQYAPGQPHDQDLQRNSLRFLENRAPAKQKAPGRFLTQVLDMSGGASRIRTADLWIMIPSL